MDANKLEERFAFYARHEEQLEEWFRLRKEFREKASLFYAGLDNIRSDPRMVGAIVKFDHGGYYRRLRLFKREWDADGRGDKPSIWLEWNQDSTFADGHLTLGIRCDSNAPPSQATFRSALEKSDLTDCELGDDSSAWRVFMGRNRMPPPGAEYWKELSIYRNRLAEFIVGRWIVLSDVVDEALKLAESEI